MLNNPYAGIISGELAESKKVSREKLGKIPDIIRTAFTALNREKSESERLEFEIIRMDQFLAIAPEPQQLLHAALMLASRFRLETHRSLNIRAELKLSLAVGPVELARKQLRESDGTAIRMATSGLERMKRNQRLSIETMSPEVNNELEVSCSFMDILIHDWSDEQAEAVFLSLEGLNQIQISQKLDISQPAVNRRLKAAHIEPVDKLIKRFEKIIA